MHFASRREVRLRLTLAFNHIPGLSRKNLPPDQAANLRLRVGSVALAGAA